MNVEVGNFVLVRGYEQLGYGEVISIGNDPDYPITVDWDKDSLDPDMGGDFDYSQIIDIR